jgi:PAS domain S-box-containing protein
VGLNRVSDRLIMPTVAHSLRARLLRLVLLASALALLCVAGAVFLYEVTTFRPHMIQRLQNQAALLDEMLRPALQFQDPRTTQARLQALTGPETGAVYDREGQIVAEHSHGQPDRPAPRTPETDGVRLAGGELILWHTIRDEQTVLGHLYLAAALPPLYARLPQYAIMVGSVMLALFVMALALRRGLHRHALSPLADLVATTRQVTQQGDYTVRTAVRRDDEFGQLATALNHMLGVIGERDTALRTATARIREVFAAATEVAIVTTDLHGNITLFNSGAERMFGYPAAEMVGREAVIKLHDPAEMAAYAAELSTRHGREIQGMAALVELAARGQSHVREWTFVRKDGTRWRGQLVVSPVRDEHGQATGYLGIVSDITERQKTETALRESEQRFRSVVEHAHAIIFILDRNGVFQLSEGRGLAKIGLRPGQVVGTSALELYAGIPSIVNGIRRALAGDQAQVTNTVNDRVFDTVYSPYYSATGEPNGVVGVAIDITERMRAETALRESEAHLQCILGATADGLLAVDTQGRVLLANWRFAEMWRIPPALLEARDDLQLLDFVLNQLEDPEAFRQRVGLLYDSADQVTELIKLKNDRCFERYSAPLLLGGASLGRVWSFRDVTDQKRAEEELQRRERRFRSLIENGSDMILVLSHDGTIRFQSPSSERVLGITPAAMTGRNLFDFVHPDDQFQVRESLRQALNDAAPTVTVQVRIKHQNGSWRRIEVLGRSVPDDALDGDLIINARDITEATKLEEQLRQAQKMEAVGQLSGGVAHDFNNLLTVILGHVSLLQTSGQLPPHLQESVTEISQSAERAASLTRQLLAFSRRHTMQPAAVDLNETVANMTKLLRRVLGEDITMHLHYAPRPGVVRADAGMMEQVLLNLVVNARDAMPRGGQLTIETAHVDMDAAAAANIPQARTGSFVRLSVTDSGCGIAPEIMPHIFEPFFTTKDVGKGSGLGLATVYGIIQHHEGWINVHSTPGQGSTFHIYLPQFSKAAETRSPDTGHTPLPRGTETILLVEDEPALRILARKVLIRLGYRILEAASGVMALEVWRQHRGEIRLLLTDMVMPDGMSGRELAQRLQTDQPQLKIIYTSGYSPDIAGRDFPLRDGVNFLPKPFGPAKLAQLVRTCLDS